MGERFDWHLEEKLSPSLAIMTLPRKQANKLLKWAKKRLEN